MGLSQQIVQKQSQRLMMTQDLRQSIELLAMSNTDLLDRIQNELMENPLLEEVLEKDNSTTPDILDMEKSQSSLDHKNSTQESDEINTTVSSNDYDLQKQEFTSQQNQEKTESKHQFLENSIQANESLQDYLIHQLRLLKIDEQLFETGAYVISSINDKGFLTQNINELVSANYDKSSIEKVLLIIQNLDPIGCGTNDIKHTLLVQSRYSFPEDLVLHDILENDFQLVEKLEYEKLAARKQLDLSVIENCIKKIKTLEPYPGSLHSPPGIDYIVADLSIVENTGELEIIINDDMLPKLALNKEYTKVIDNKEGSREDKEYIQKKMESANWLINGLGQRKTTLLKTMQSILKYQRDFFEKGPVGLKPLTLKIVAKDIDMHESTISRITSNKYVQTKWGVLELKYFFSSSVKASSGDEMHSSRSIQSKIKKIIAEENADDPVSDQTIVELLKKAEIKIARRTVAKYRNILNILPVDRRRKMKKLK